MKPCYLTSGTFQSWQEKIEDKIQTAHEMLKACTLCSRQCRVNRLKGETGFCSTRDKGVVASYHLHFGEEEPLVKNQGSGTIFFSGCNLGCSFCQNYEISHGMEGIPAEDDNLAAVMLELQNRGALNINFVSPTHVVPMILTGLKKAIELGLTIPLVYNTGGYDAVETIDLLDGVIDIYMPDFKFWEKSLPQKTCGISDYREIACLAIKEMHRQVGDLVMDENGVARKGLLIRHLVMPCGLADVEKITRFLVNEISEDTYVNIMSQYRPWGRAHDIPEISRPVSVREYREACDIAVRNGLSRFG